MSGHKSYLPPAHELIDIIDGTTYDKIADQYGVTRQAVHKRLDLYCVKMFGYGIAEYRKRIKHDGRALVTAS